MTVKRFKLKADVEFEAIDLEHAWMLIAEHFNLLAARGDPGTWFTGQMELRPLSQDTDVQQKSAGEPRPTEAVRRIEENQGTPGPVTNEDLQEAVDKIRTSIFATRVADAGLLEECADVIDSCLKGRKKPDPAAVEFLGWLRNEAKAGLANAGVVSNRLKQLSGKISSECGQENCDGDPYDWMQHIADELRELAERLVE